MHDNPREKSAETHWGEAAEVLAELTELQEAAEPLAANARAAIIAHVLAQQRTPAADLVRAPVSLLLAREGRWRRVLPLAAGLAVAASLALMLRSPADVGPVAFEVTVARAFERGAAVGADERLELSLRNEPGWTVRLPAGSDGAGRQLYVAALGAEGSVSLLEPRIERLNGAFRVEGEVRDLGLHVGDVTLFFILGPENAHDAALLMVEGVRAGETPPKAWAVKSRDYRIKE